MGAHEAEVKNPFLSNRSYDSLKQLAQYWLPALGVFYTALATIWGLPYGAEVVGTIVALDTLLGVLLGLSTKDYKKNSSVDIGDDEYDGSFIVDDTDPDGNTHSLEFDRPLSELEGKKHVALKVSRPTE